MKKRVVIVGGGVSGLFAGLDLAKAGFTTLTLVEASDRLGGRVHSHNHQDGVVELGAQWIHGRGSNPLWKYVQENNIAVSEETGGDGDGTFLLQGGFLPNSHILHQTMKFLDDVHDELNDVPKKYMHATTSVEDYFRHRFSEFVCEEKNVARLKLKQRIFDWFLEWEKVDTGVPSLKHQSVLSWGEYVDYDLDGEDSEPILEHGYQDLIRHLENKLKDAMEIKLNTRVNEIRWQKSPVEVVLDNSQVIEADHVVVTVSLGVLKHEMATLFNPSLPANKVEAIQMMGYGVMNKIILGFEEPFWNLKKGGIQLLQDKNAEVEDKKHFWIRCIPGFDQVVKQPNLLGGWICGEEGLALESFSDTEIGEQCCKLIQNHSKASFTIPQPTFVRASRWGTDPNFRGSYSYRTPACDEKSIGPWSLAEPLEYEDKLKVLFCGEATSCSGYGTVHGAMETGQREAERLIKLYLNTDKT